MRKIVQVKGANGSGKTTIARQLIALSSNPTEVYSQDVMKGRKPYATLLPDLGWVVIGSYPAGGKSGGCDTINQMDDVMMAIQVAAFTYDKHWILFEGAMIATTMTCYNFMLKVQADLMFEPAVVILYTTMDGCLRRLEKRKGDGVKLTPEMFTQLAPKLDRIPKQKHQPEHVYRMDVDQLSEGDMVYEFLSVIGWSPNLKTQP